MNMKMYTLFMQRKALVVSTLTLLILGGVGSGIYYFFWYEPPPDETTFREEYSLVLKDYDGRDVQLSDFRREILIVYAWASWCPYCGAELEYLSTLKEKYGDDLAVVAVNRAEPRDVAREFTSTLTGMERLTLLIDESDSLYKEIQGYAMPETMFIDNHGDIVHHQRGPIKPAEVDQKVLELMQ